jgi:hypothetical protein
VDRYVWLSAEHLSYLLCIERCIVQPIGPVDDIRALGSVLEEVLVGSLVDGFDLVAAEDDGLNRPVLVHDIVDL